jgi:deoxycytidine triphosphate deaminase
MPVAKELKKEDINILLQNPINKFLTKSLEDRYAEFKEYDPFPSIPDSLLNSHDIVRYVFTTGMIDPFIPENLEGAVYKCNFSGYYKYWDDKHMPQEGNLDKSGELLLRHNSISFLEIEPTFQIPSYIVLRFNLKVQHVYKGLLLGTGPIVDPGFVGKLYIPLHNLTSNDYIIKKDALLICVEFTKLSKHDYRNLTKKKEQIANDLDFSNIPVIVNSFEASRDFDFYLRKALIIDDLFRKTRTDEISVGSSIPETILEARVNAGKSEENAKKAEESAIKAEEKVNRFGWIALIVTFLTIGGLVFTIYSLIDGVNARIDNIFSQYNGINKENMQIQKENKYLKEKIDNLQSAIDNMQQPDKAKKAIFELSENKNQ